MTRENIANDLLIYLEGLSEKFIQWNKDRLNNAEDIYGNEPVGTFKPVTQNYWQIRDRPSSGLPKTAGHGYNFNWHGSLFDSIYTKIADSGASGILLSSHEKDAGLPKWKSLLTNIYKSSGLDAEKTLFGFTNEEIQQIRNLIKPYLVNYIRDGLTM